MATNRPTARAPRTIEECVRNPRKIELVNTVDGELSTFFDDGGRISGTGVTPNGNRQGILHALRKRRTDKGHEGLPVFVARQPIEPMYNGDPISTDESFSAIARSNKDIEKHIADSRTARGKRARQDSLAGLAEMKASARSAADKEAVAKIEERLNTKGDEPKA